MKTITTDVPNQGDQAAFEDLEIVTNELPDELLEFAVGGMMVSIPKPPPTYLGGEPGCWDPADIKF